MNTTDFNRTFKLGPVELNVADLQRSVDYYQQVIGLQLLEQKEDAAVMGIGGTNLLYINQKAGAKHSDPRKTGLYHLALLLPSRPDLGRFLMHLIEERVPVQGASDHSVSEAIYLGDPDGHGIEVYADRDPNSWDWEEGQVQMRTKAADVQGIIASAGSDLKWRGLPEGTIMGHVHLRVARLDQTLTFYRDLLGMKVAADMTNRGALFVSKDDYHHHFGLNIWESQNGSPAPETEAKLVKVRLAIAEPEFADIKAKLLAAGYELAEDGDTYEVKDPSGNVLRLSPMKTKAA